MFNKLKGQKKKIKIKLKTQHEESVGHWQDSQLTSTWMV